MLSTILQWAPILDQGLSFVQNVWTSFSGWAAIAFAFGASLIALPIAFGMYVPEGVRKALVGAGAAITLGAVLYQLGMSKGAHEAFRSQADRALAAETKRANAAEYVRDKIASQAARDFEMWATSNKRLKDLNDALAKDADRDRDCLDRDTARRLRHL